MGVHHLRKPEILLIAGLCVASFAVAVRTQQTRPERHARERSIIGDASVPADASSATERRTDQTPPPSQTQRIAEPNVCTDVHRTRAPELRALPSRAAIERYSQEVVRLPVREPLGRGWVLARTIALDPSRDGAEGRIELYHHHTFVSRSRSARSARWIFEDVSAGGDCRDHRLVLRWVANDGAVRDQVSILSGYADVRLANVPSDARRSIWLEHDDCHSNPRVQSQQLRLFDVRAGRIELVRALDERGEWTAMNTRNSVSSHWLIEEHRGERALSVHEVELYHSSRGPAHDRCIDLFWQLAFDGRCWRASVRKARVAGSEGLRECEIIESIPQIENIVRSIATTEGPRGESMPRDEATGANADCSG